MLSLVCTNQAPPIDLECIVGCCVHMLGACLVYVRFNKNLIITLEKTAAPGMSARHPGVSAHVVYLHCSNGCAYTVEQAYSVDQNCTKLKHRTRIHVCQLDDIAHTPQMVNVVIQGVSVHKSIIHGTATGRRIHTGIL